MTLLYGVPGMFGNSRIKLDPAVLDKAQARAQALGYASIEEYLIHLIEQDARQGGGDTPQNMKQKILNQMKGLGYLE